MNVSVDGVRVPQDKRSGLPDLRSLCEMLIEDEDLCARAYGRLARVYPHTDDLQRVVRCVARVTGATQKEVWARLSDEPAASPMWVPSPEASASEPEWSPSPPPPRKRPVREEKSDADYHIRALTALSAFLGALTHADYNERTEARNLAMEHARLLRATPEVPRLWGVSERAEHLGVAMAASAPSVGHRAYQLYMERYGREPAKRLTRDGYRMNVYAEAECPHTLDAAIREAQD